MKMDFLFLRIREDNIFCLLLRNDTNRALIYSGFDGILNPLYLCVSSEIHLCLHLELVLLTRCKLESLHHVNLFVNLWHMPVRLSVLIDSLPLGSKISCLFMEVGILLFYFHLMKNIFEVFFIYAMYMISLATMVL